MEKFMKKNEAGWTREKREQFKKLRRLSSEVFRGHSRGAPEDEADFLVISTVPGEFHILGYLGPSNGRGGMQIY